MLSYTGQWYLAVSLMTLPLINALPASISSTTPPATSAASTASRANVTPIGETMKQLTDPLTQLGGTSHLTFDTRTPPKYSQQLKAKRPEIKFEIEFGHPGVAEPVDDDEPLLLEEANKKMNFYKVDRPTTDSGLSTWILLSGQSSTAKPAKKAAAETPTKNATAANEDKVIKPIFKRKSTTSPPPSSTTLVSATKEATTLLSTTLQANLTTAAPTADKPEKTTKLTKIKASIGGGGGSSSSKTTPSPKKVTSTPTTAKPAKAILKADAASTTVTTLTKKSDFVKVATKSPASAGLKPEAKEGVLDLSTTTADKKPKRPTTASATLKKKKNKNRRKKPIAEDKTSAANITKLSTKHKERPIGAQLYNYLSREVMPTVGVGLVGLMVTAGLASYFLYPFGALRRSYEIDRKDKEAGYHYTDEYSGGIAEEEAIGKVIAGMPANNYYNTRSHNSRNTYGLNDYNGGMSRFRKADQRYVEGSVESVALNPMASYQAEEVIVGSPKTATYANHKEAYEPGQGSVAGEEQFMVNVLLAASTEAPTPAVVPEHGPRTIEDKDAAEGRDKVFAVEGVPAPRRRKRQVEADNEIEHEGRVKATLPPNSDSTKETLYDTTTPDEDFTATANPIIEKTETIFGLIKDLIYLKLRLGLQLLHDKAESLSRYFKNVQARIDDTYAHDNVNHTLRYS